MKAPTALNGWLYSNFKFSPAGAGPYASLFANFSFTQELDGFLDSNRELYGLPYRTGDAGLRVSFPPARTAGVVLITRVCRYNFSRRSRSHTHQPKRWTRTGTSSAAATSSTAGHASTALSSTQHAALSLRGFYLHSPSARPQTNKAPRSSSHFHTTNPFQQRSGRKTMNSDYFALHRPRAPPPRYF